MHKKSLKSALILSGIALLGGNVEASTWKGVDENGEPYNIGGYAHNEDGLLYASARETSEDVGEAMVSGSNYTTGNTLLKEGDIAKNEDGTVSVTGSTTVTKDGTTYTTGEHTGTVDTDQIRKNIARKVEIQQRLQK